MSRRHQCQGTRKNGQRCKRKLTAPGYCRSHEPDEDVQGLNEKQRRFVDEYCIDCNAAAAARRAGYSADSARFIGHENLTKPNIRAAIDERLEQLAMTAQEATARLAGWARGSVEPFVQVHDGHAVLDLTTQQARDALHLVRKLKVTQREIPTGEDGPVLLETRTELELHDAKDAVVQILKMHGAFVDRVEHSGPGGGAIPLAATPDLSKLSDTELEELERLLEKAESIEGDPTAKR